MESTVADVISVIILLSLIILIVTCRQGRVVQNKYYRIRGKSQTKKEGDGGCDSLRVPVPGADKV